MKELEKYEDEALRVVADELRWAKEKFPHFAKDMFQAVALLGEEYGETCAALNDHTYDGKPINEVIVEAGQTAAVAIRTICLALRQTRGVRHGHA
jgi:hypothetical protein